MDMILKNKRNICLAGCVLMAIAVFFTFATISVSVFGMGESETASFIEGDGWIVLVMAIASGALIWFKKEKISLVTTGIALVTTFIDMANAASMIDEEALREAGGLVNAEVELGMSPWLVLLGVILAAGPIVLAMVAARRSNPSGADNA